MDTANAVSIEPAHWTHSANDACWLDSLLQTPRRYARNSEPVRTVFASRPEQIAAADDLVHRRYAWRGYRVSSPAQGGGPAGPRVTLLAESNQRLLGTLTVRAGSSHALLAEQSYASEIESLRNEGRRLGELVKLAIEEGADWRVALETLVHSAYVVTRFVHSLTDVVIEVNPRHVRFYQRVFGFVTEAAERFCARAGAPSVLMRLDLERFGQRIESLTL